MFDLLYEVRDKYNETLLKKWAGVFRYLLVLKTPFYADDLPIPFINIDG